MTVKVADPLPECALCGEPTKRDAHERNGGLCTACTRGIGDTVRMLPVGLPDPDAGHTVYVERYRPPVPGPESRP